MLRNSLPQSANVNLKTSKGTRSRLSKPRARHRLQVELLEDRWMPSAVRPGFSTNSIPASGAGSIGPVSLGFAANFFGVSYDKLWINAPDGDVTFDGALSSIPFDLTSSNNARAIIAPFFSALDTSSTATGLITYGTDNVDGHVAFGVTWSNVGPNQQQGKLTNTFQVVLIAYPETGQGNFDIEFNYDQIQWDTSPFSGNIPANARAGFSNGTNNPATSFELPGSGVPGSFVDSNPMGLTSGSLNSSVLGRYVFHVRSSTIAADTTALTSSVDTSVYGQPVTFTAAVTSAGSPVTTGTVTFQEGNTILASAVPLDSSGHASFTSAALPAADVPHTITASYSGGSNFSPSSGTTSLTVDPAPLTVTAKDANKVYGQNNPAFSIGYDGFVNGDTPSSLNGSLTFNTPATAASPVGSYAITPGGLTANNYTIRYVSGTLTITPAPLTVTARDANKTYGQTLSFTGAEFTTSGLLNNDTVTSVTLSSAGAAATATVAGSPYDIVPSAAMGTGLGNYTISYVNGKLTVNPAGLTVTAKDASKTYGRALSFAGTEFTTSGLLNSDTVTSAMLSSTGAAATAAVAGSPYQIVPSAAIGTGLDNYTINYVNGKLVVNPAPLSVKAKDATKTYGQTLSFVGSEFTTSGLLNSDTVTTVMLSSAGAAASATVAGSPYDIVPSAAMGTGLGNYTVSYVNGKLTVTPTSLSVTAKDASKSYGQTLSFAGIEFTTSGLLNSDTVTSVALTSAGAAASATVAGSPYDIVPSAAMGTGLGNYTISYVNGKLMVSPAVLTVTAKDATKPYGQALSFAGTEFTTSGLLNSDTVTSVTLSSTGAPATAVVAGSPYPIVPSAATGTGLGNYVITQLATSTAS